MSASATDAQIAALQRAAVPVAALTLAPAETLSIGTKPVFDEPDELTVELWVRAMSGQASAGLLARAREADGQLQQGWRLAMAGGAPEFRLAIAMSGQPQDSIEYIISQGPSDAPIVINDGAWHHVAFAYRPRTETTLMVDGRIVPTTMPMELRFAGTLLHAATPIVVGGPPRPGAIDVAEIRIWSIAREVEEIALDRLHQLVGEEDGLIGYWRCNALTDGKVASTVPGRPEGVILRDGTALTAAAAPTPSAASGFRLADTDALAPDATREVRRWRQRVARAKQALETSVASYRYQQNDRETTLLHFDGLREQIAGQTKRVAQATVDYARDEAALMAEHRRLLNELRAGTGTRIAELVSTLGQQIQATRDHLQQQGAPYRLARVAIELRAMPAGVGAGLILPTEQELRDGSAASLSLVRAEFAAIERAGPPSDGTIAVPDLTGYTRAAAERKLAESGLQMAVRYQAVPPAGTGASMANRALSQDPAPGGLVAGGGTVTVTFGEPAARGTSTI